jgi:hypothetical protein
MAASVASNFNTYVPSFEASGKLITNYSRNPTDFAINRYIQITRTEKDQAYFLAITPDTAGRIINSNISDFIWPDGNYAPTGAYQNALFNWNLVSTVRYNYPFQLGAKAVAQAAWPILAVEAGQSAQLAMTARTLLAMNLLFTIANFDANHTATATALAGGKWSAGSSTNPYIEISIMKGAQAIQKTTLSAVRRKDLVLVISPSVAQQMATSAEVKDYFKSSVFAAAQLRGDVPWLNANWGLPDILYNVQVVVEDASMVTTELGAATTTYTYVADSIATNQAVLVSRPGGLEGQYGTRSFSTVTGFFFSEMEVESFYDSFNRLHQGRVVEDFVMTLTAPAASYLFQQVV